MYKRNTPHYEGTGKHSKIARLAILFDDRDPNNKGWYARAFDSADDEIGETTAYMPRRSDAWRKALRIAKFNFGVRGHIAYRVYAHIEDDLPMIEEA